jgi:putative PIN family toxin of toxin-antitoxin system
VSRTAVIVDTNVVVAGLLTAHEASPVARILDGMLAAAFPFVVSEALLAEYRTVLVRPNLRKLHGLTVGEVEVILTDLAQHAIVLAPVVATPAPDPGDQLLWELLASKADLLLVTGDKLLLRDAGMQGRVISPQAFVAGAQPGRTMKIKGEPSA